MNIDSSIARAEESAHARHLPVAEPARGAAASPASPAARSAPSRRSAPWRDRSRPGDRRLHLDPEHGARVMESIQARRFESATREVLALPVATPELSDLLGALIQALAHAGEHAATNRLIAELLARSPLRPELAWLLVDLAEILTCEQQLTLLFESVGLALRRIYGFQDTASLEWAQRLAYQLRRHGNAYASACILRTWRALMLN